MLAVAKFKLFLTHYMIIIYLKRVEAACMLTNITVALPLSKVRFISWYSGVGLCFLRVKDQCNSGTDLAPEYLLKTSVLCKADHVALISMMSVRFGALCQ